MKGCFAPCWKPHIEVSNNNKSFVYELLFLVHLLILCHGWILHVVCISIILSYLQCRTLKATYWTSYQNYYFYYSLCVPTDDKKKGKHASSTKFINKKGLKINRYNSLRNKIKIALHKVCGKLQCSIELPAEVEKIYNSGCKLK